jgi:hypothetical protein
MAGNVSAPSPVRARLVTTGGAPDAGDHGAGQNTVLNAPTVTLSGAAQAGSTVRVREGSMVRATARETSWVRLRRRHGPDSARQRGARERRRPPEGLGHLRIQRLAEPGVRD